MKTIEEINEKIARDEAIILTAAESNLSYVKVKQ